MKINNKLEFFFLIKLIVLFNIKIQPWNNCNVQGTYLPDKLKKNMRSNLSVTGRFGKPYSTLCETCKSAISYLAVWKASTNDKASLYFCYLDFILPGLHPAWTSSCLDFILPRLHPVWTLSCLLFILPGLYPSWTSSCLDFILPRFYPAWTLSCLDFILLCLYSS